MAPVSSLSSRRSLMEKAKELHWFLLLTIILIAVIGAAMLASVSRGDPALQGIAMQHIVRFSLVLAVSVGLALTPLRFWAMIAYPAYIISLLMLVGVEFMGSEAGGAVRWLAIGPIRVQPSEFMKIALLLTMARFYHQVMEDHEPHLGDHLFAVLLMVAPAMLVLRQPDLGTTLMLLATGGVVIIFAGLNLRIVMGLIVFVIVAAPIAYKFGLKDYQRDRVETFLDPSRDPLGAGYQLQQAKIAIGSGEISGKGFMQGTQSQNDYIPEQHTDFIFTILAEEFGFGGTLVLLGAWAVALGFGLRIACETRHAFGALAAAGVVATIAFYVVVNIGMVMGLMPVVGVPLPLMSYGGTVMATVMTGCAIMLSVHVHRETPLVISGIL